VDKGAITLTKVHGRKHVAQIIGQRFRVRLGVFTPPIFFVLLTVARRGRGTGCSTSAAVHTSGAAAPRQNPKVRKSTSIRRLARHAVGHGEAARE
jgi:hypothetical protein